MKPIVLATDGSPSAAEATLKAVELARTLEAPLIAVAVDHVELPAYGYYGYAQIYAEVSEIEHERVAQMLVQTQRIAEEAGVECELVHATGPVVDAICEVARERKAQMIVIGAHGWGLIRRTIHGSISSGVLHDACCPVLVVRGATEALLTTPALDEAVAAS
jgi:nucleotide-binding universal stress UspA family protein